MKTITILLAILLLLTNISPTWASEDNHYTLIINQVRGDECCDVGEVSNLKNQINKLKQNNLNAAFSIRYDAINQTEYQEILFTSSFELGGMLEITPSLAKDSGAIYKGDESTWFEAQNAFLIGYTQEERKKLIDTYMRRFQEVYKSYPKFTTAWMIDAWSLQYLRSEYGVISHQMSREQFGTDSYTLYGGPVHYPYYPSQNWAMISGDNHNLMPLIIRHTIMDPVYCYGDRSSSYTSQPNDYQIRGDNLEYFIHLHNQAHSQQNDHTIAVVGLENSIHPQGQIEYLNQLEYIGKWQKQNKLNQTTTPSQYQKDFSKIYQPLTIYGGSARAKPSEQAWWINTKGYRARVRLSNQELYISDLRIYSPDFQGPYLNHQASSLGWWIVPFTIDGSREYENPTSDFDLYNDLISDRKPKWDMPSRIKIKDSIQDLEVSRIDNNIVFASASQEIIIFSPEGIQLNEELSISSKHLVFLDKDQQTIWEFNYSNNYLSPLTNTTDLNSIRKNHPQQLMPEINSGQVCAQYSYVYENNAVAVAGRNPIRLVFYPKNCFGQPIFIDSQPKVEALDQIDSINIQEPFGDNGMIFIDFSNSKPVKTSVKITSNEYVHTSDIIIAPNCKSKTMYCITHPRQAWWYIQSIISDKTRQEDQQSQNQELFFD